MEGIITEETGTGAVATTAEPGSEEEQKLAEEIARLWEVHAQAKTSVKKTKAELKAIRERLSERLYEMKQLLARPGRNGQWSAWLKEHKISRASADRLVQRFAATLPGHESPHEAASSQPIGTAEELARGVWPSFRKVLSTHQAVVEFLGCIAEISGVPHEWREEGLVIFNPVPKAADELPGSASPTDHTCQPSDEAAAMTEEPAVETAAAPPATEQVAGAGDGNSGDVL